MSSFFFLRDLALAGWALASWPCLCILPLEKPNLVPYSLLPPQHPEQCWTHTGRLVPACWSGSLFSSLLVLDTNDRFLRKITVGQGNTEKGHSRQVGGIFPGGGVLLSPSHWPRIWFSGFLFSFLLLQGPVSLTVLFPVHEKDGERIRRQ